MFSDVTEIHPLASDIQAAVEYGIINGFLDGTFKTDATITRQEAMAMYARAMDVVRLEGLDIDRIENYEINRKCLNGRIGVQKVPLQVCSMEPAQQRYHH